MDCRLHNCTRYISSTSRRYDTSCGDTINEANIDLPTRISRNQLLPFLMQYISNARANYGIIRVIYVVTEHLFDKDQYTRVVSNRTTLRSMTGRTTGGSISIVEMKLHQLWASAGLMHCMNDLVLRGDTVSGAVCLGCSHIRMLCECHRTADAIYAGTIPVRLTWQLLKL